MWKTDDQEEARDQEEISNCLETVRGGNYTTPCFFCANMVQKLLFITYPHSHSHEPLLHQDFEAEYHHTTLPLQQSRPRLLNPSHTHFRTSPSTSEPPTITLQNHQPSTSEVVCLLQCAFNCTGWVYGRVRVDLLPIKHVEKGSSSTNWILNSF